MKSVWIGFFCGFRAHNTRGRSKSVFWRYLATTHYAGASADLLAEAEVPSVASDTNIQSSLSGGPSRIFPVPYQELYKRSWAASSDQILLARMVKNMEKIDPIQPRKIPREREKGVRLAEHLIEEEPIQQLSSADKCSLYVCEKFCCSDANNSDMADD